MKKRLYLRFLENEKDINNNEIKNKNIDLNVNKISNIIVLFNYITNLMLVTLKALIYILTLILISIGITSIVNPSIRGIFLNLF